MSRQLKKDENEQSGVIEEEQQTRGWRQHFTRKKKLFDILKFEQKNMNHNASKPTIPEPIALTETCETPVQNKSMKQFFLPNGQ